MKTLKIIGLMVCLALTLVLNSLYGQEYKIISICHNYDPSDCLKVLIPKWCPDFAKEYGMTKGCLQPGPPWMPLVSCSWYDAEGTTTEELLKGTWYTLACWIGMRVHDAMPISLKVENRATGLLKHYLYDEEMQPIECSEYKYHMHYYEIYGWPIPTEEEFYAKRAKEQAEWEKYLKEEKQAEEGQKQT